MIIIVIIIKVIKTMKIVANNTTFYTYDKLFCLKLGMCCLTKRKREHLKVLKWVYWNNRISTH